MSNVLERLHDARYVYWDAETSKVFAWFGGQFVLGLSRYGVEKDFLSLGSWPKDVKAARYAIQCYLAKEREDGYE